MGQGSAAVYSQMWQFCNSLEAGMQALRRDPDSAACARGLKRLRAMTNAKEAGNAAFKSRQWAEALQQYSTALKGFDPAQGNETFFAQCFGNRSVPVLLQLSCVVFQG